MKFTPLKLGGLILGVFLGLGWLGWFLFSQSQAEPTVDQVLRLHILANSDTETDQAVKRKVRDEVLAAFGPSLAQCSSRTDTIKWIEDHRTEVLQVVRRTLQEQGAAYDAHIELGSFMFPLKTYGQLVFPAGEYEALRILLGQAEGQNWWCVLYPPLCFIDATTSNALPATTGQAVPEQIQIRWKAQEWLTQWFKPEQ